ncbi:MAG: GNAT family N-acetyltransferase [Rickettsiales bacterium]|nr:GNAT family N-acetyltransferase [Rickettsiales bacterium]
MADIQQISSKINVKILEKLTTQELMSICQIAESTMLDTYGFSIGFKRWYPPMIGDLEQYFSGVMLIRERKLVVSCIDTNIVGSLQLLCPHALNKLSSFVVSIHDLFVVRTARNLGIAEAMIKFAEEYCRGCGYKLIKLSIRSDMTPAITLVEKLGYKRWGVLDKFELLGDTIVSGYFYCKDL